MKILLIDDNTIQLNELVDLLNTYLNKKNIKSIIKTQTNANNLNEIINDFDMIFLDIEIGNKNGIDIAKNFRKINKDIKLILISNYSKYLIDGYKVNADRYFLKPINSKEFEIEMNDIIHNYILNHKFILSPKISNKKIYIKNILYIEIYQRKSIVYLSNKEKLSCYITLKHWNDILCDCYFSQSHRAFLVNLQNIVSYNNKNIYLIDDTEIPLSRFYRETFQNEYMHYLNSQV